jgi:hypothetical protein
MLTSGEEMLNKWAMDVEVTPHMSETRAKAVSAQCQQSLSDSRIFEETSLISL